MNVKETLTLSRIEAFHDQNNCINMISRDSGGMIDLVSRTTKIGRVFVTPPSNNDRMIAWLPDMSGDLCIF